MNCSSWITIDIDIDINPNVTCNEKECELNYPCVSSFVCKPYAITLARGAYLVDVFGAEGGGYAPPGKGGEMKGILSLSKNTTLYAYVGAKGESGINMTVEATFGGGGSAYGYRTDHFIGTGGGASDLRLDKDSLASRIIVAGGGGGSGRNPSHDIESPGGDGSGDNGRDATTKKGTAGSGAFTNRPGEKGVKGIFGYGGNVTRTQNHDGSGGGGGYYGGNAGSGYTAGGGGGSGFISKRLFRYHESFTGVREGHGKIVITRLLSIPLVRSVCIIKRGIITSILLVTMFISR